jgi:hypothetical protein
MATFIASATTPVTVGVATITPTLPTWAAGDIVLIGIYGKYGSTSAFTGGTGWTLVRSATGGTVTTGNDAGDSFLRIYARVMQTGDTAQTFTAGTTAPNSWGAVAVTYRVGTGNTWADAAALANIPSTSGNDTTAASPLTATGTFATQPSAASGATLVAFGALPTDQPTAFGTPTITATGISGGTSTQRTFAISSVGADSSGAVWDRLGWTGTATSATTIAITPTGVTNNYGPVVALWLRELAPKVTSVERVSLATASIPSARTNHVLGVRGRYSATGDGDEYFQLQLYEGATARSVLYNTGVITGTMADYTVAITDTEAASITSYTDLEIRVNAYSPDGDATTFEIEKNAAGFPKVYLLTPSGVGAIVDAASVTSTSESSFTGAGSLIIAAPAVSATADSAITGVGGLDIGAVAAAATADTTFTGAGASVFDLTGANPATSDFTGSGNVLIAAVAVSASGDSSFTGFGASGLKDADPVTFDATSSFVGAGTLDVTLAPTLSSESNFTGAGATVAAIDAVPVALSGDSTFTGAGTLLFDTAATLRGDSSWAGIADIAGPILAASVSFDGSGVLTGAGGTDYLASSVIFDGAANAVGAGALVYDGAGAFDESSFMSGNGVLDITAVGVALAADASFAGTGQLDLSSGSLALDATSSFTGAGTVLFDGTAALSALSDASGSGTVLMVQAAAFTLDGQSFVTGAGDTISVLSSGNLSFSDQTDFTGSGTTLAVINIASLSGDGSLLGVGALVFDLSGAQFADSVASGAGVVDVLAPASSWDVVADWSGVGSQVHVGSTLTLDAISEFTGSGESGRTGTVPGHVGHGRASAPSRGNIVRPARPRIWRP